MPVKEKKTSRAEFAYDTLKRRILDNQLPPGAMLSEVALAQKLNMSRTPIREALKMLMRDDLVEIRDGVGTFVKSATQKDIEDAYAVRQALEVLAARTAIGAFSSEELDALEARFAEKTGQPGAAPTYGAPTVVYVLSDDALPDVLAGANAGAMVENMLLSAADQGLASVYLFGISEALRGDPDAAALLRLPEGFHAVSAAALGYPAQGDGVREKPVPQVDTLYLR